MSAGLFALLDDVAVIAKLAAASVDDIGAAAGRATTKTIGVVIDDTAVSPQYVHGLAAERELPIVGRIAKGSLRNKLVFILPAALLLSQFAPGLIPVILICGGLFLAYEGTEKVIEWFKPHHEAEVPVVEIGPEAESRMVAGAVRTDLILSTEIMVIALNEVADESIWSRLAILAVVAVAITIGVYGVVALIVKMDDIGLGLAQRRSRLSQGVGRGLVKAMPGVLTTLSIVGTIAMLWVGGHLLVVSAHELGVAQPYGWIHGIEHDISHAVHTAGSVLAWAFNTLASFVVGIVLGAVVVGVLHLIPHRRAH
jgi:predicted DNA repair protein MutK